MRAAVPVPVVIHRPQTPQGQQELAARIAAVHARAVSEYIRKLNCSAEQKSALAEKVMVQIK